MRNIRFPKPGKTPRNVVPGNNQTAVSAYTVAVLFAGILAGVLIGFVLSRETMNSPVATVASSADDKKRDSYEEMNSTATVAQPAIENITVAPASRVPLVKSVDNSIALAPERDKPLPGLKPRIVIIIDDMGMDIEMFERIRALPGPLTLSFLPYAPNVSTMANSAARRDHEIMLHLPMEPIASDMDPGPGALRAGDSAATLRRKLAQNLSEFSGYVGVNNHMGSLVTADDETMQTVLSDLKYRNLYFVDSVTSGSSAVMNAAEKVGAEVYSRSVFLDAEHGHPSDAFNVRESLKTLEKNALESGFAIGIGHPRRSTIDVLGPWLVTAEARGFEITTVRQAFPAGPHTPQKVASVRP